MSAVDDDMTVGQIADAWADGALELVEAMRQYEAQNAL